MLFNCFYKGVNSVEKEVYDVLQSGKSKWQNNMDIIQVFVIMRMCILLAKKKNLEVPHWIVRNGYPWGVEFGEEQESLLFLPSTLLIFEKFVQVNMQHSYN